MPRLSNCTLCCSPDPEDHQYWSSFDERPFACGHRMQVYKGILNGKGPRVGEFSVVKIFIDQPGTKDRCLKEVVKSREAAEWARNFLRRGQYQRRRLQFVSLLLAPIDHVSIFNKIFVHNKRRPASGEWILLEELVQKRGQLTEFVDKEGRCCRGNLGSGSGLNNLNFSRSGSIYTADTHELLEAFVHFTYAASSGDLVVCGLCGSEDEDEGMRLKTPIIHSRDRRFGETDCGEWGIHQVMKNHVCSRYCRRLGLVRSSSSPIVRSSGSEELSFVTLTLSSSAPAALVPSAGRLPTAPYESDVISGNDIRNGYSVEPTAPYESDVISGNDIINGYSVESTAPLCEMTECWQSGVVVVRRLENNPPPPYSVLDNFAFNQLLVNPPPPYCL